MSKKVCVIIKHPYRDWDWRVDIYDVPEEMSYEDIRRHVESKMLGPFEVVSITDRMSENNKIIP